MSSPAFEHAQIGQDERFSWGGGLDGTMHYGARQEWYDMVATAPSLRPRRTEGHPRDRWNESLPARQAATARTLYEGDFAHGDQGAGA